MSAILSRPQCVKGLMPSRRQAITSTNEIQFTYLTCKQQEMIGCILSTVTTDALALKHQAISTHSVDYVFIALPGLVSYKNIIFTANKIRKWIHILKTYTQVFVWQSIMMLRQCNDLPVLVYNNFIHYPWAWKLSLFVMIEKACASALAKLKKNISSTIYSSFCHIITMLSLLLCLYCLNIYKSS